MRKKIIIFLAVAALCLVVAFYWYNKPRQNVTREAADFSLGAVQLYEAYNADESTADRKFLNKVIEVKGTVEEVTISGNDAVVMLQPQGGGISCRFSPAGALDTTRIKTGMEITVKGKCTGFNIDVNLTDCIIIL